MHGMFIMSQDYFDFKSKNRWTDSGREQNDMYLLLLKTITTTTCKKNHIPVMDFWVSSCVCFLTHQHKRLDIEPSDI